MYSGDGGVQINPGPTYAVDKTVLGSFHQDDRRSDDIAGIQYACNSLYAIC